MCGIVGFINKRYTGAGGEGVVLRDLLTAGTVRGHDGTGVFTAEYNALDKPTYMKTTLKGAELLADRSDWSDFGKDARFVVGHNRAATSGKLDESCTHPFVFEHVVGVHNGTVHGWRSIFPKTAANMDSEAIYEAMDAVEPDAKSITKVLASLKSEAYALVWYDVRTKQLHFARNSQRPLCFAQSDGNVWFASERLMLAWILDRNKVTVTHRSELATHTLLSLSMDASQETSIVGYTPDRFEYAPYVPARANSWADRYSNSYEDADYTFSSYPPARNQAQGSIPYAAPRAVKKNKADDYPPFIDVTQFGALPFLPGIQDIRPILYDALEDVVGVSVVRRTHTDVYANLLDAMATRFLDTPEVHVDLDCGAIYADLTVIKTSFIDKALYGYVTLNGEKYVTHVDVGDLTDLIRKCYETGCEQRATILSGVKIIGIRMYATGEVTLLLDPIKHEEEIVMVEGHSVAGGKGLTECIRYGTNNPAYQSTLSAIKYVASDWHKAWEKKVTVTQTAQRKLSGAGDY